MDERQIENIVATAHLGSTIREFCRHPGFATLQKFIGDKVADTRNAWLRAPNAQMAEELRIQAKPYLEIETFLKSLIIAGDQATMQLTPKQDDLQ